MKQRISHGTMIDALTPDEAVALIPRPEKKSRVRAAASIQLNAAGTGQDEVYKVPAGMEFEARRVTIDIGGSTDPATGNVVLNVAGKYIKYLRSGAIIEDGQPQYGAAVQVPGVQTWGDQQGPYLRNGEVFEVFAAGLTANAILNVFLEGILRERKVGESV